MHIEGEMFPAVIISQLNLIRSHNNNNDKQLRGQAVFFFLEVLNIDIYTAVCVYWSI